MRLIHEWKLSSVLLFSGLAIAQASHAVATESVTYVYTDVQGTVLAETDEAGNVTAQFDYRAFGRSALGGSPNGPGYAGHVNDADTGLVYMQARYYDPDIGRFLGIDASGAAPSNLFNFNRFAYANNNPVVFIDPDGNDGVAVVFPEYKVGFAGTKWGNTGHAGELLINPSNGLTRYYEFGRYGNDGMVRNVPLKNNVVMRNGAPTPESLARVLTEITSKTKQGGPIEGAYFSGANFNEMDAFAKSLENKTATAGGYGDWSLYHSCITFARDVLEKGGVTTPSMADPRPKSYISELQGAEGAQPFRFENGSFKGVFRVDGRIDSRRLDKRLPK